MSAEKKMTTPFMVLWINLSFQSRVNQSLILWFMYVRHTLMIVIY